MNILHNVTITHLRNISSNLLYQCDLDDSVIFCLSWKLPVVLQFNFWVAKPHIHQHQVPSQRHYCFCQRVFRQEGYLWKDLKQIRSVCSESTSPGEVEVTYLQTLRNHVQKDCHCVCGISRLLYDILMFCSSWFWICHALSLWRICLHHWRLILHDLSRIWSKRSCSTVVAEQ